MCSERMIACYVVGHTNLLSMCMVGGGADFASNYVLLAAVPSFCYSASTGEAPTLPGVSAKKIHTPETAERTDGRTNRRYTTTT